MEPTDSSAFEYINVDYAVRACKWSKFHSLAVRIAASVTELHSNTLELCFWNFVNLRGSKLVIIVFVESLGW